MPEYKPLYVSPQFHEQLSENKGRGQSFEHLLRENLPGDLVPDE